MWLRHINICMEYTRLTVHHFCHFQFLTLVLSHEVTVWSCRKENVNRYSEQILLVSGLWIYGTLCLRRLCLLQLWIVWRIDLFSTVSTSDTVITGKISSFNDQSTSLSGLSWTALLLLLLSPTVSWPEMRGRRRMRSRTGRAWMRSRTRFLMSLQTWTWMLLGAWEKLIYLPQHSYFCAATISVAFAVFCTCLIVKGWLWVPVYFKHYHCCWQCGRGHKTA